MLKKIVTSLALICFWSNVSKGQDLLVTNTNSVVIEHSIYTYVDEMPSLSGGAEKCKLLAIRQTVQRGIILPSGFKPPQKNFQVFAQFVVTTKGDVTNATLVKAPDEKMGKECGAAVVDAINRLPRLNPGKNKGELRTVMIMVPVNFSQTAFQEVLAQKCR